MLIWASWRLLERLRDPIVPQIKAEYISLRIIGFQPLDLWRLTSAQLEAIGIKQE